MKIDLHCHSHFSDGSATFEQIVEILTVENIKHFSITDHDFYGGELNAFFLPEKLTNYRGIEISAKDYQNNKKVHLLGYEFDPNHKRLKEYTEYYFNLRKENSTKIIRRLISEGYKIELDDFENRINNNLPIYKQHIMEKLIKAGYTDRIYGQLYHDFREQGIFQELKYISYQEGLSLLKDIEAKIFLAHPAIYENWDIIPILVNLGLEGIEVYHKRHNQNDILLALEYADKYNLLVSGGSDYHGSYSSLPNHLGVEVPDIYVEKFIKAIKNK
ncbi:MAG: phosphatase [Firmicutes bacterium]|nr:phosphatase [Bacillota bacterium]